MSAEGTRRFKALMAALPAAMKREIDDTLVKQADELVGLAKRAVPVRSGLLRDTIRAERTQGRELSISVKAGGAKTTKALKRNARYEGEVSLGNGFSIFGTGKDGSAVSYDYAAAIEFGTLKMSAQPFFYPSYRLRKPAIRRAATKAVKKVVADAVKGS